MDKNKVRQTRLQGFVSKVSPAIRILIGVAIIFIISAFSTNADPITKPYEFNTGDIISAPQMNSNFDTLYTKVNELDASTSNCAVRVYSSNTITLTNEVYLPIPFNEEVFDTDDMHSSSPYPSHLTAATSGLYLIICHVQFTANSTGLRQVYLRVNGSTPIADVVKPASSSSATWIHLSTIYYFNAGDYVEARAYQNSSGDLDLINTNFSTPAFMMVRLTSDL